MNRVPAQRFAWSAIFVGTAATIAGCGTSMSLTGSGGEVVQPRDFVRTSAPDAGDAQPGEAVPSGSNSVGSENADGSPDGVVIHDPEEEVSTNASAPPPPAKPLEPGEELVVDSMVGQINGRPIYANQFLEPLEGEIRAEARRRSPLDFTNWLRQRIALRMLEIRDEELLLARAAQMLTPEQQLGLFRWLDQQKGELVRRKGGSERVAEVELEETEGLTLDEALDERKKIALIRMVLDQEIKPRVIVSWKDVERKYRTDYLRGGGSGELRLGWIHVSPDDTDKIEQIQAKLDAGEAFEDVADFAGMPAHGAFGTDGVIAIPPGGLENLESESLFDEFAAVIRKMKVGETSSGSEITIARTGAKRYIWWHVYSVTYPEPPSLYDPEIQLRLQQEIFAIEFEKERQRYMQTLMTPVIQAEIMKMVDRLAEIARKRYL